MKTKQHRQKWVRITLAVMFTMFFVTVGLVFAYRGDRSLSTDNDSAVRFQQYMDAIAQADRARDASLAVRSVSVDDDSKIRFQQYTDAIAQADRARDASLVARSLSADNDSTVRFQQYMYAIEQADRARDASLANR